MRSTLRLLVPLCAFLALAAWGSAEVSRRSSHRWAERDLDARARLVLSAVRSSLVAQLGSGDARATQALLDELVHDERLKGAAVCAPDGRPVAATAGSPEALDCPRLGQAEGAVEGQDIAGVAGVEARMTALAILDGSRPVGSLVLLQDLSFLQSRRAATDRFTFLAFALAGLVAATITVLAARLSRSSWSKELRRLLPLVVLRPGQRPEPPAHRALDPVIAEVRELMARLAAEDSQGNGARWSAGRLRQVLRENLHGESLLVVANREPYIHEKSEIGPPRTVMPASGLVTALEPVMRACSGTWIAHGSGSADRETVDRNDHLRVPPGEGSYTLRRVWLQPEEERGYYYGFANEGLWPLCHNCYVRPEFRVGDADQYFRVNRRFADVVVEEAGGPDPIVLVQDYHFAPLPQLIRERLPRATILTFWHIPWPSAERLGICPWDRALVEGLLGSSIAGFHTQEHCNNFLESVDRTLEARIDRERQSVVLGGRETLVRPYPISIEWPIRWVERAPPVGVCRAKIRADLGLPPDSMLGVGVDRLDYTKGIVERLLAVERMFERWPERLGKFWFVQIAAPSRTMIERYGAFGEEVERVAARINERFGADGHRPIVLLRTHHQPSAVVQFYRAADLCYVSSLHDGMNLVAKEFVAAREDLRGVLVLSRFTGAARELTEALIVNPYDLEEASSALAAALSMPEEEQEERMRSLQTVIAEFNVYRWAGRMLLDATRLRQRDRLASRLAGDERHGEGGAPATTLH